MWLDYDEEADVLYVHFTNEVNSTSSEMREDGVIFDYKRESFGRRDHPGSFSPMILACL